MMAATALPAGVPSGASSAAAERYYAYLFAQYYADLPVPHTGIRWSGPAYVALWGVVLIGFFFLYAWFFQRVHRKHNALYGVSSFAGAILERIGPVSVLTMTVWLVVTLWALYYAVVQPLRGYIY